MKMSGATHTKGLYKSLDVTDIRIHWILAWVRIGMKMEKMKIE